MLTAVAAPPKRAVTATRPEDTARLAGGTAAAQATKIERAGGAERATPSDDDWLIRSLIVVLGLGGAALLLALVSEDDRIAAAFARTRSRLRSRGLSATHLSLGDDDEAEDRRGAIRYRD